MTMTNENKLEHAADARAQAECLLESLIEVRAESERRLAESGETDLLKSVTGRSSLDTAIEDTERLIGLLGRSVEGVEAPMPEITVLVGSTGTVV